MGEFMTIKIIDAATRGDLEDLDFCLKLGGFDINTVNSAGTTALLAAASRGNVQCVERLLQHPDIDVNKSGSDKKSPLFIACQKGYKDLVGKLLKHPDIDVNTQDKFSTTALMVTLRARLDEILIMLLNHPGIDVNQQKKDGTTALMYAVQLGHLKVVREFLKRKDVDIYLKDNKGVSAEELAKKKGNREIKKLLSDYSKRKESRLSSVRSRGFSSKSKNFMSYANTLSRTSSLAGLMADEEKSAGEGKNSNDDFDVIPAVETVSPQKKNQVNTFSTMIRMRKNDERTKEKQEMKSKINELLDTPAEEKTEKVTEVEEEDKTAPEMIETAVESAVAQTTPVAESVQQEGENVTPEAPEEVVKDTNSATDPEVEKVNDEEVEVEVKKDEPIVELPTGPEFDTPLGQFLAKNNLTHLAKSFHENNIKSVYVAAKLSDFDLKHTIKVPDAEIEALIAKLASSEEAASSPEKKIKVIIARSPASNVAQGLFNLNVGGEMLEILARKPMQRLMSVNPSLTEGLINSIEHSSSFICIISDDIFIKEAGSPDFGPVYCNLVLLVWAYLQKVNLFGYGSISQAQDLLKQVMRQGADVLTENEWRVLNKYNVSYPNVYDALEFLSKNVVSSIGAVKGKLEL